MSGEFDRGRRCFIGRTAASVAAVRLGVLGSALQQAACMARAANVDTELTALGGATEWINTQPLTADALRGELTRLSARSHYHSVAIVGGDALAEHEFLEKTFHPVGTLPLMIDHDGQRPESLYGLVDVLTIMQVSMDGTEGAPSVERVCSSIDIAARKKVAHAVAIVPDAAIGDAPLLRIVEQVHEASAATQVVLHPAVERAPEQDRRWVHWLERAMAVHEEVRILPRWPLNARTPAAEQETRNAHSG